MTARQTAWSAGGVDETEGGISAASTYASGGMFTREAAEPVAQAVPTPASPPTAAEAIANALADAGFSYPWYDGAVDLDEAIQVLLDRHLISVGDRLWVEDDKLGMTRPVVNPKRLRR